MRLLWKIAAVAVLACAGLTSGCHSMKNASDEATCGCAAECACTAAGEDCKCEG